MADTLLNWTVSKAQNDNEPCFLDLLSELRIMVYERLLPLGKALKPRGFPVKCIYVTSSPYSTVVDLGLMASCRQIHYEAAKVLYTKNAFRCMDNPYYILVDERTPGSRIRKVPVIPDTYAPFARHIVQRLRVTTDADFSNFEHSMEDWLSVVRYWPSLRSVKMKLVFKSRSDPVVKSGSEVGTREREVLVANLVAFLRSLCCSEDRRVPKDLELKVELDRFDSCYRQDASMFYDAVQQVKRLKSL